MYSAPTYDVNRFIGGVSSKYYASLRDDPHTPMLNRALQGAWAPASTWKLATAVIGLQLGLVSMESRMPQPCNGGYFAGRVFKCWDHKGHGDITLAQAIAKSCDVYFYQLGIKIGLTKLLAGGVQLGFGERTGIDLPSEVRSQWPEGVEYFNKKYGPRGWTSTVVLSLSIGQANNAQTPLNMAKFYTALATDGAAAQPQIVARDPVRDQVLNLKPEQLRGLQDALSDVLTRGTGAGAQIQGLTIAGKTGTSQRPPHPDDAWFVGYAPANEPKIVVAVILEEGLHGTVAAKLATKVMESYLKRGLAFTGPTND
jgi:penicillin-binding protein 2